MSSKVHINLWIKERKKKNYPTTKINNMHFYMYVYYIKLAAEKKFSGKKTIKLLKIAFFKYIIDVMWCLKFIIIAHSYNNKINKLNKFLSAFPFFFS